MFLQVLELNKALTGSTLFSASAADFNVVQKLLDWEELAAELTGFRPEFAVVFMVTELRCQVTELAILALDSLVGVCLVVFFFGLGHNFATNLAFVVTSGTPDVMHSEFGGVNHSLAGGASLLLFGWLNHFKL